MTNLILNYEELMKYDSFKDRYLYLKQNGKVGQETFGFERYLNQKFYRSKEWEYIRDLVIVRDGGCDLGCPDHPIKGPIYIHHMNPITSTDIVNYTEFLTNPDYLVCVSHDTHNAIHYGDEEILNKYEMIERTSGDTCPWKK